MYKQLLILLMAFGALPAMAQLKGSVSDGQLIDSTKFTDVTNSQLTKVEQKTEIEGDAEDQQATPALPENNAMDNSRAQRFKALMRGYMEGNDTQSTRLSPEFFAMLGELASDRPRQKLNGSADDSLSCLGIETTSTTVNGPGVLMYVDPHSDLFAKITPGDLVLSIDGAPVVIYSLRRANYGNSGSLAKVSVLHQNGVAEQLTCERHPMKYFSSFVQQRMLPY
jgi:C-terminal processing protease CtpA/Prc